MTFLDLVRKVGELGRAKCHPDCDIVVHRREAAMYMGVLRENPELLRELAATPSSGVTEGKAESGERIKHDQKVPDRNHALNVIAGELSSLYGWLPLTHRYSAAHEALAEVERRLGLPVGEDLFPRRGPLELAAQPPAPADDAAEVLAGLLAGFEHERWWSADDEVKFEIWTKAMKRVEAAQQRLADQGQGGGSDG